MSPPYDVAAMSVIHTRVANEEIQAGGNRFARAPSIGPASGLGARSRCYSPTSSSSCGSIGARRGPGGGSRRCRGGGRPTKWPTWSRTARPTSLVVEARLADLAAAAAELVPAGRRFVVGGADPRVPGLERGRRRCPVTPLDEPTRRFDTMLYTSGTTGRPKGVRRPPPRARRRATSAGAGCRCCGRAWATRPTAATWCARRCTTRAR